ncbi:efflux RND transporter periplasmic adaptor subunit [Paenibacillus sp. NPDC058174]|uniref:efflux RND transporter periplasmic adaptor subunit n=1 Tax=Paenibacillus sp. NPDC058174 TaxID=3346366 RepID=UPI0036DB4C65
MFKLQNSSRAALALLTSLSLLSGCSLLPKEEAPIKPPLVKPAEQNYSTVLVEKGDIRTEIRGAGFFESTETDNAQFISQGGRIEKVSVKSGDTVKKGDLLLKLGVDGMDLQILEQRLALQKAEYALKQLKRNADDPDAMRLAELQLDIEKLKYDKLQGTIERSELRASMDGLVVFVEDLEPGDTVQPYQTLVTVVNPSKLRFSYQSSDTALIREASVGMKAEISTGSTKTLGKVVQTPSTAPETTNEGLAEKYKKTLYVDIDKLPEGAKLGMSGDLVIILTEHKDTLVIPKSGLRTYMGRTFVRVLDDKALREIDVETGLISTTLVEITKGLDEGQKIVMN